MFCLSFCVAGIRATTQTEVCGADVQTERQLGRSRRTRHGQVDVEFSLSFNSTHAPSAVTLWYNKSHVCLECGSLVASAANALSFRSIARKYDHVVRVRRNLPRRKPRAPHAWVERTVLGVTAIVRVVAQKHTEQFLPYRLAEKSNLV